MIQLAGPSMPPAAGGPPRQLVVMLHGVGADGNDLIDLAPILAQVLPEAEFLSPDGPYPCDMAPFGRQWFSLLDRTPAAIEAGVRATAPILDAYLDAMLAARGLSDDQLALVGFSQGTMMALHVALRRPRRLAGLVGFSGRLVAAETLPAEILSRPPVLLVHGDADEVLPIAVHAPAVAGLERVGVPVTAHVSPGLGHGIDEQGLRLAMAFLAQALAG